MTARKEKISRKLVTIDSLLTDDDVKVVIEEVIKDLPDTEHLLIVSILKDGTLKWTGTPELHESQIIWACEVMKHDLLDKRD